MTTVCPVKGRNKTNVHSARNMIATDILTRNAGLGQNLGHAKQRLRRLSYLETSAKCCDPWPANSFGITVPGGLTARNTTFPKQELWAGAI